jgi:hypothetical protein
MHARALGFLGSIALMLFTVGRAAAQPSDDATRAEARKIGYAGVEAYQAGDFATAHDRLETAYQLLRVPSLGLWSARALAKVGKLVEADARYLEVIRLPTSVGDEAIQEQARRDATSERADVGRRIPVVLVRVEGAPAGEVAVTIDGASVAASTPGAYPVNPGRHKIEGVRETARATAEVVVAEGEKKEAVLRLAAPLADAAGASGSADTPLVTQPGSVSTGSSTTRTIGWATLAGGGAGLAVGVVTGLMVRSKKNHLDSVGCGEGGQMCPASEAGNVDSYNSLRPVPAIGFIVGAALTGVGAYLLLTTPAAAEPAAGAGATAQRRRPVFGNVRLAVVPGGTLLSGEF